MAAVAVVVAVPQLVGLLAWDTWSRHRAAEAALTGLLERAVNERGAAEACALDPEGWARGFRPRGHRGPPPHSHRGGPPGPPRGPRVEPARIEVRAAAPEGVGTQQVGTVQATGSLLDARVAVAMATGWGGACAYVVARGSTAPGFLGSVLPANPVWIAPAVLLVSVMLLAVGPTVTRIRRLTEAVRRGERLVLEGDDEIAELSRALDTAQREAADELTARRQSERALREFVANTAHDVRVPLTVLRGHLTTLETRPSGDVLQQAVEEAHYLGALLDNLAAHARMDDRTVRTRVSLPDLVERVASRHRPLARRASIELVSGVPGEDVFADADPTLAEQALSNLVYNAVRHNRPGGHVAVVLDLDGDRFRLAVTDDGPGVPDEELGRLTERGYTSDAARGRDAGQGLGLSIVARVAAEHGWDFTLGHAEEGGLEAVLAGPRAQGR